MQQQTKCGQLYYKHLGMVHVPKPLMDSVYSMYSIML